MHLKSVQLYGKEEKCEHSIDRLWLLPDSYDQYEFLPHSDFHTFKSSQARSSHVILQATSECQTRVGFNVNGESRAGEINRELFYVWIFYRLPLPLKQREESFFLQKLKRITEKKIPYYLLIIKSTSQKTAHTHNINIYIYTELYPTFSLSVHWLHMKTIMEVVLGADFQQSTEYDLFLLFITIQFI